jgi:hypothetical protein
MHKTLGSILHGAKRRRRRRRWGWGGEEEEFLNSCSS